MRPVGGAITQAATSIALVGAVGAGLVVYTSDHRSIDELAAFEAATTRASTTAVPFEGHSDQWGRVAIYPVIEDGTLNPVPENPAADIWSAFLRMVGPRFAAERMSALLTAYAPDNPTVAEIERATVRPLRWRLTVNLAADLTRPKYLRVLVHEYAHLLTLDHDDFQPSPRGCTTLRIQEGCLREGTTLELFEERFWEPYYGLAPGADSESSTQAWAMYLEHADDFLTVYAATNVVEDLAETFTEFVIRDRPDRESGTWAEKILFFWEDPEYVAIRRHIRAWFGPELPQPLLPVGDTHRG